MTARTTRCLVIDASIARASGAESASYPTSKHCRDFLAACLRICHRVVTTPEINAEWRRHRSRFFSAWLRSMYARKKVECPDLPAADDLWDKVSRVAAERRDLEAMHKDFMLVVAALASDRVVVSLDETARKLFAQAAQSVGELKSVIWVNPDRGEEDPIRWLQEGAPADRQRQLGSTIHKGDQYALH